MDHWVLDQNQRNSDRRLLIALLVAMGIHGLILAVVFIQPAPPPPLPPPIELTLDAPLAARTHDATPNPGRVLDTHIQQQTEASQTGTDTPTVQQIRPGAGIENAGSQGQSAAPSTVPAPDTFTQLNQAVSQSLRTGYMTSQTLNGPAGAYLAAWKRQVEQFGNSHYPAELLNRNLSGQLILAVTINRDGHILDIAIQQSSGNQALDYAARRLVQLASPYPKFPPALAAQYDQIVITRTWLFSSGHSIHTDAVPRTSR
ncbi:energy transducer TonB [Halothiobacillus sp. DCM-1]|uniref:energy transducer TonB n=1 Tax=Halothiobacillus sp. DCM-1 TaxID=3112558 RepID=UPI003249D3DA